jgi:hypothetical protein
MSSHTHTHTRIYIFIYLFIFKKLKLKFFGGGGGWVLEKQYLKVGSFEDNVASKKDKYLRIFIFFSINLCIG